MVLTALLPRQTLQGGGTSGTTNDPEFVDDRDGRFWYSRTGQIVRWSIFFGLFILFMLYIIIGYWHAKRRISKGLPPLAYHRWLLNRQQRATYDPTYQNPRVFYNPYPSGQYAMPQYPAPPPMYNPNAPMPPMYQPPEGGSKVDPSQYGQTTSRPTDGTEPSPAYTPPSGPPPAALHAENTGASTTSNNPYRM